MTRFSPRAKILLYILLATTVFISGSLAVSAVSLGIVLIFALRVPLSTFRRGLIPISLFLTFTFISNLFFQAGNVRFEIFGLPVTDEGLRRGGILTLKLFILILGAKLLTATTDAGDLVNAMGELLGPIGKIGFVKELILTMSLTLRLLPIVYDEAADLYKNVKNSKDRALSDKIKLSVSLLAPLFENSLKKAKKMAASGENHGR